MDKLNVFEFDPYLPQGSKSGAKSCACAGTIFDPRGKFRECSGSGVTSVTQHNGGVVATVTNSSSFGQRNSHTHEYQLLVKVTKKQVSFHKFPSMASLPMD